MHCKLRQSDIHADCRNLRSGNSAQGRSARNIGVVGENLIRNVCRLADFLCHCLRHGICRIFLIRTLFDDDSLIHIDTAGWIIVLRVCRVLGMGIVCRYQETVRNRTFQGQTVPSEAAPDPLQRIRQERGRCSLFRAASNLFVVKHTVNGNFLCTFRRQKSFQRSICTLKVIQSCASHILFLHAVERCRNTIIQKQIHSQDIFLCRTASERLKEMLLRVRSADDRQHILLRVIAEAFIHLTAQMDRHVWDHRQISF